MAIENLPRPWLLAALTGLRLVDFAAPEDAPRGKRWSRRALLRPEPRRRRLRDVAGGRKLDRLERLN